MTEKKITKSCPKCPVPRRFACPCASLATIIDQYLYGPFLRMVLDLRDGVPWIRFSSRDTLICEILELRGAPLEHTRDAIDQRGPNAQLPVMRTGRIASLTND